MNRPQSIADAELHGDAELAATARELLPADKVFALGIAAVTPTTTRTATIGAPLDGSFEIGSINKAITGMFYVDACERGEVHPHSALGEFFDLPGAPAAHITLAELAQHRSGLPADVRGPLGTLRMLWDILRARNPYHGDVADLVAKLRRARLDGDRPSYSNLGFAALGHAVAAGVGVDYPGLVEKRSSFSLRPRTVPGRDELGRAQEAWDDAEFAPAGGISADVTTMAGFAGSLLDGSAPGLSALDPVRDFGGDTQIGAGWLISPVEGRAITWHNGGTGGFRSWLGLDRAAGTAVFIVGATSVGVDEAGEALLLRLT